MITEADVPHLNADALLFGGLAKSLRLGGVLVGLGGKLGNLHDTARGGSGGHGGGHHGYQSREGCGQGTRHAEEQSHMLVSKAGLGGQAVNAQGVAAVARQQANEAHDDAYQDGDLGIIQADLAVLLEQVTQVLAVGSTQVKGLDQLDILEDLLVEGEDAAVDIPHLFVMPTHDAHHGTGGEDQNGRAGQSQESHDRILGGDDEECADKLGGAGNQVGNKVDDARGDVADVSLQAVDEIARVVIAQSLPTGDDHLAENILADLIDHANADAGGYPGGSGIDEDLADRQGNGDDDPLDHLALHEDGRDRADQSGLGVLDDQSHAHAKQAQNNVKGDAQPVPLHIVSQPDPLPQKLGQTADESFQFFHFTSY